MVFAYDTEGSLLAAVALVNSALEPPTLTTPAELRAFFVEHRYSGRFDGDQDELNAVQALRPPLRALLTSSRDDAAEIANGLLDHYDALPRLVKHDHLDWHLHAVPNDSPLATRIAVETAMAMVDVIRVDEIGRLGLCADPECEGLVLDLSRNRSRRFCSTTCGNRVAVAAYRARKA